MRKKTRNVFVRKLRVLSEDSAVYRISNKNFLDRLLDGKIKVDVYPDLYADAGVIDLDDLIEMLTDRSDYGSGTASMRRKMRSSINKLLTNKVPDEEFSDLFYFMFCVTKNFRLKEEKFVPFFMSPDEWRKTPSTYKKIHLHDYIYYYICYLPF